MNRRTLIYVGVAYAAGIVATYCAVKSFNAPQPVKKSLLWPMFWFSDALGGLPRAELPEV